MKRTSLTHRSALAASLVLALSSCLAAPPAKQVDLGAGRVRADDVDVSVLVHVLQDDGSHRGAIADDGGREAPVSGVLKDGEAGLSRDDRVEVTVSVEVAQLNGVGSFA